MNENLAALTYAVRPKVVAKYLGQLMIMLALLTAAPLAVALLFGEWTAAARLTAVTVLLVAGGIPAARLRPPAQIQTNEALVVVAGAFLIASVLLAYPLAERGLSFHDALFEAVSAVTTTGLSTVGSLRGHSHTFLFLRAWMQWFGGMGIAVLSVALLMSHHVAARRLTEPVSGENLVTTSRTYARRIVAVYLVMTVAAIATLRPFTPDTLTAIAYSLSAVSTGGFSPTDNSLLSLGHWEARWGIMAFAFLGAVPLALYHALFRRNWRQLIGDIELQGLVAALLIGIVLLSLFLPRPTGETWTTALAHTIITAASAQTTTGFSTIDVPALNAPSKGVLILSMFIGGGVGSTAGGIKILRLLIMLRLLQLTVRRTALAGHTVVTPRLAGKTLEDEDIIRTLLLILSFIIVVLLSWLAFLAYGYAPLNSLFEVVSATDTVGLSTGITRPGLQPTLKTVLCADMLLGRLEVIALLVVLYPKTWIGNRTEST